MKKTPRCTQGRHLLDGGDTVERLPDRLAVRPECRIFEMLAAIAPLMAPRSSSSTIRPKTTFELMSSIASHEGRAEHWREARYKLFELLAR